MFETAKSLEKQTSFIADLGLSRLLLKNDRNYPWVILVPRRENITEIFELDLDERTLLIEEISITSAVMKKMFDADKMNVAALGNADPQLHVHIIARRKNDKAWPRPVWGAAPEVPYAEEELKALVTRIAAAVRDAF